MSFSYPDGSFSLVSAAEKPHIGGVDIEAVRTVTRSAQRETIDNYSFIAWIDDYHAVVVQATSDPTYKPQANPIDPKLAKDLLTEAVSLVTSE